MRRILRRLFLAVVLAIVFVISDSNGGTLVQNSEECKDDHKACPYWSQNGECQKNPEWMLIHCKRSCGKCDDPCFDVNVNCTQWALEGECLRNPGYMLVYCPKSCDSCNVDSVTYLLKTSSCSDHNEECQKWAKDLECQINPQWMLTNCAQSCDSCRLPIRQKEMPK